MFAWKEKKNLREQAQKLSSLGATGATRDGKNRRAIGLLPLPGDGQRHEISQSNYLRYHQLLISLEGKQSTCCLRVASPKNKSRSAILLFRGRVLGCLYGSKNIDRQLFGEEALERAVADLAAPGNVLDAYVLSEELVLAAAALFHGHVLNQSSYMNAEQTLEMACQHLLHSDMPGCVVISSDDNLAACMVYMFGGKIVGVYSFKDGWVQPTYETALHYLQRTPNAHVMASKLTACNVQEVMDLTFSVTGLADRRASEWTGIKQDEALRDLSADRGSSLKNTMEISGKHLVAPPQQIRAVPSFS
jgi:hypothetical protein